jgi:eukaryotic-like serine/threonine-protein kinase
MSPSARNQPPPPAIPGYTFDSLIGDGGYSAVYLYTQKSPKRPVAVKVLRDFGGDLTAIRQFSDEAGAMATLGNHAHIVPVFASDVAADGQPYLIMPFYSGPNLAALVGDGPLPVAEVVTIGVDISGAVHAAHMAGIVHRDIKPANILTDEYGERRLTDFGIAGRVVPLEIDSDFGVSVPWSPPEILGTDPGSVASDVYSLGATLWHLLVGHSPFEVPGGDNRRTAIENRILTQTAPPIARTDAPPALVALIAEMLSTDPARRSASADDVARRLRAVQRQFNTSETTFHTTRRGPTATPVLTASRPTLPPELTRTTLRAGPAAPRQQANSVVTAEPPGSWLFAPPDSTIKRDTPATESPVAPEPEPRSRRWRWAAAAALVIAAVGVSAAVSLGNNGGGSANPKSTSTGSKPDNAQNAGVLGEDTPPGTPTVTLTRKNDALLHVVWTYSAPLSNDTFKWRTPDGRHSGTTRTASLDLADAPGVQLCVQVKVVRADGSNASVDWSPAGCGK